MTVHCEKFDKGDIVLVEVMLAHFPPTRYKGQIWVRICPRKAIANVAEEKFLIEKNSERVGEKVGENNECGEKLNENQKRILHEISENKNITIMELSVKIGISKRKIYA